MELDAFVVDLSRNDGLEAQGDPGDQACEAETSDGGGEEIGVFGRRAEQAGAIRADEFELCDVAAEGSSDVVILSLVFDGNGSTESYIFCAGRDGKEEAARDREVENLRERHTGLGGEEAGF